MAYEIILFRLIPRPDTSSLTGVPIAGSILSIYGSYNGLIWLTAASFITTTVLFVAARVIAVGWSPKAVF